MPNNLYAKELKFAYRIYDPTEKKFCCSGRSLYAQNGRNIWKSIQGAHAALRNMPSDIRDRLIIKRFFLVDIEE